LKADAPEFIPSGVKTNALEESSKKYTPKEAAKAQKKLEKEEKKAASLRKKIAKKARFQTTGQ
jgi:hypothetical protein